MPSSPFATSERRARLARLIARPFAHRGRHGGTRVENSLGAFAAAIAAGDGIELDVQLSGDGEAIVFHDETLDRLTEEKGALACFPAETLRRIRLRGSDETLPSLADALDLIAGNAGLLIELKAPARVAAPLCAAVERALVSYSGEAAVMSFNPEVGRWFAAHAPDRLRGLVVTEKGRRWRGGWMRRLAAWRARPDFLAYDIRDLPSSFADRMRRRGVRLLTWTCRSADERARAARHADQIIHELAA